VSRAAVPDATADRVNRFGVRLLDRLRRDRSGNLLVSPCSAAFCLGVAVNGAAGPTRAELAGALGLEAVSDDEANAALGGLRRSLTQPGAEHELHLATAVWAPSGATIDPGFRTRVERSYAAEVRALDPRAETAAEIVNGWVRERTSGRIPALVGPADLDVGAGCLLTDVLFFRGRWAAPFDTATTEPASFTGSDGTRRDVEMMRRSGEHAYLETDEFQAVCLDHAGARLRTYVLLPAEGADPDLSAWGEWLPRFRATPVALTLPRFSAVRDLDLVRPLAGLGISTAFAPGADFGRMGIPGAFVTAVRHTARVDVTEQGARAAAATAVVLGRSLPRSMVVDRPFVLAVADRRSGLLIFLAWITDPGPAPGGTPAGAVP
jgi:serine protease inhibitor